MLPLSVSTSPPLTEALNWSFLSLCTTKERILFVPECTKYSTLWVLGLLTGRYKSCAWLSPSEHQERVEGSQSGCRQKGCLEAGLSQGIPFWLRTSTVSIIAFTGLLIRDARFIFIRCVEQEAACKHLQGWKLWLFVVGILPKPSLQKNKKSSRKP